MLLISFKTAVKQGRLARCFKNSRQLILVLVLVSALILMLSGCGSMAAVPECDRLAAEAPAVSTDEQSAGQELIDISKCTCGNYIHSAPADRTDTTQFSYIFSCIVDNNGQDYYLCSSSVITDVKIFEVFFDVTDQKYYCMEDTYFYHDKILPSEAVEINFKLNSKVPDLAISYKTDGTEYIRAFAAVDAQGELRFTDIKPELTRDIMGQTYQNYHTTTALRDAQIAAAYAEAYSLAEELFSRHCFVEWDHYCEINENKCFRFYVVSDDKISGAIAVDCKLGNMYVDYNYDSSFFPVQIAEDGSYKVDKSEQWTAR